MRMTYITVKLTTCLLLLTPLLSTYQCSEDNQSDVRNLLTKMNTLLDSQSSCSSQPDKAPRPCFDMTSSQSVLQQLCDKITALEVKVDSLSSTGIKQTTSLNNDKPKPYNISIDELSKIKKEIESLKRWSAFSAVKIEKVANNSIKEPIKNYNTTINEGTGVGFDSTNGVYMAHYDGIYRFSLKYPKPPPEVKLETSLVSENIILAKSGDELSTQLDVMTSLKIGQQVWADFTTHNTPEDYQVQFTFSGFLLN